MIQKNIFNEFSLINFYDEKGLKEWEFLFWQGKTSNIQLEDKELRAKSQRNQEELAELLEATQTIITKVRKLVTT